MTQEQQTYEDIQDLVSKALRRAWQLGQTYWQQADSDSFIQHKKSDATQATFDELIEDTRSALAATQPAEGVPAAIDPNECGQDVFNNGVSVGLFDIPKDTANAICVGISEATGVRLDWHYIAGRVHIKVLAATQPAAQGMDARDFVLGVAGLLPDPRDGEFFRWLTGDHESAETRIACVSLIGRMSVMSTSAVRTEIANAIAAQAKQGGC